MVGSRVLIGVAVGRPKAVLRFVYVPLGRSLYLIQQRYTRIHCIQKMYRFMAESRCKCNSLSIHRPDTSGYLMYHTSNLCIIHQIYVSYIKFMYRNDLKRYILYHTSDIRCIFALTSGRAAGSQLCYTRGYTHPIQRYSLCSKTWPYSL